MKLGPFNISFRKPEPELVSQDKRMPEEDSVWSEESQFWLSGPSGIKYNPDALIGKKGAGIYRKMMLDEQVKAVTRFKRDAITSRDFFFEPHDELEDSENERRIKVSNAYITEMEGSFLDAMNGLQSSMYQGFAIAEKVFQIITVEDQAFWGIKRLPLKPFDTFEFETDEYGNTVDIWQQIDGKRFKIDRSRIIHHLNNPEYDAQYGQSELREAYRAWFHKDSTYKFYGMWLERHASGFKVARPVNGKKLIYGNPEYLSLQTALSNAVNGAAIIAPSDVEIDFVFPSNNVAFKEAIQEDNLAIAKALLVPNLMGITPAGQTGSYSQSDTQLEAFLWTLDADASRLEDTLNEQLFKELGKVNFGDGKFPRFKFKPVSERKKIDIITLWKDLVQSKSVQATDTDELHIRELIDFPEPGDPINEQPKQEIDPTTGLPVDPTAKPGMVPNKQGKSDPGKANEKPDETITGRLANIAMSRAQKRVDFSVIERASVGIESEHSDVIAQHLTSMVQDSIFALKEVPADKLVENIDVVKFNTRAKSKMNKLVNKALQEGWELGQKHAAIELDKAKGAFFAAKNIDGERVKFISEDFFQVTAFKASGKLTDEAQAKIEQIILNGAKMNKTIDQIEQDIYAEFARSGMITEEAAKQALGEAMMGIASPQARINTMLRTNVFSAINEARHAYFTDPILDGFVQALEYSAVMDNRTTPICQHLDGHIHPADSDFWNVNRPPNHFNCRSILIPVTEIDQWKESDPLPEDIKPATGFY